MNGIVAIGPEVALPFVAAYCKRWGLPIDNEGRAVQVLWFGCVRTAALRAVMGLDAAPEDAVLVYGLYGDGSGSLAERRALIELAKRLDDLPYDLVGDIHLPNAKMYRYAAQHGWEFSHFNDRVDYRGHLRRAV